MAAEYKIFLDANDVFCTFVIVVAQRLQDFDFDLSLLVQLLPIFEDLDGHKLLGLVVEALEHDSECSSTEFLLDFISVLDLILGFVEVIGLLIAEAIVEDAGRCDVFLGVFVQIVDFVFVVFAMAFVVRIKVYVEDLLLEIENLLSLVRTQHLAVVLHKVFRVHGEQTLAA
jgi:hypothetical protein